MAEKKEAKVRGECAAPGAIENARFIPIDIDYRSQTGEGVRWTSGPAPILVLGEWRHWNCATRRRGRRGAAVIASARGGLSAICFSRPSERTACTELHSGRRSLRACIAPRGILSRVWGANRQPTQGAYFKGKRGIVFQKREGGKSRRLAVISGVPASAAAPCVWLCCSLQARFQQRRGSSLYHAKAVVLLPTPKVRQIAARGKGLGVFTVYLARVKAVSCVRHQVETSGGRIIPVYIVQHDVS